MVLITQETDADSIRLLEYLGKEAVYNSFLISDIQNYGFDKPYQQVYAKRGTTLDYEGVYLKYYNNLILAGEPEALDIPFVTKLAAQGVDTIMGKVELVRPVSAALNSDSCFTEKSLYSLKSVDKLPPLDSRVKIAGLADVDEIYEFLMRIPSFRQTYSVKEMIINRIQKNEGMHCFIRGEKGIIAHANSAARTDWTNMLGGIAVEPQYRGKGLATSVTACLCREILSTNREPCVFSEVPEDHSLFVRLGFEEIGKWGVAQIKH